MQVLNPVQIVALGSVNQSANTIAAGPTSGSAAAPTFRAMVAADLPSGPTVTGTWVFPSNANFGVAGTTSGVITLEGSTSGSCTITGPATAGTVTNPIVFSNAIGLGSATAGTYSTTAGAVQAGYSGAANLGMGDGTNTRIIPMVLYKGLSHTATGNATNYTDILATPSYSNGSLTLVANQQTVGSVVKIRAYGTITTGATTNVLFESVLNGAAGWVGTCANVSSGTYGWELMIDIYCSAVGAAGTAAMRSIGYCNLYQGSTGALVSNTTVVATTSTQVIDVQMKFGTSNASNTLTCTFCEVTLE
jgi:hypothetical protein